MYPNKLEIPPPQYKLKKKEKKEIHKHTHSYNGDLRNMLPTAAGLPIVGNLVRVK